MYIDLDTIKINTFLNYYVCIFLYNNKENLIILEIKMI